MTAPASRGACPTLRDPMPTGDGLLARLMPPDGRLAPTQLHGLARAAGCHGNGILEITARGSLQVRGLRPDTAAAFASEVIALGLDAAAGPTIHVGPLSGVDPGMCADPRPLAAALHALPPVAGLSPKLAVVVDGGGALPLDGLAADVRLVALGATRWLVHLERTPLGAADAVAVPAAVQTLLAAIAAQGASARGRDLGAVPGLRLDPALAVTRPPAVDPIGALVIGSRTIAGLGFAFGQAAADDLAAIARSGVTEFRLAPGRVLLAVDPPPDFFRLAKRLGFIVEAADPRRQIAVCAGAPRCASGLLATRAIAEELARALDRPRAIHISGCAKGCAHPGAAPLTIVGTAAGAALVRNGTTRDAACVVVPPDHLVAAIMDEAVAA